MDEEFEQGIGEGPAKVISVSLPEGTVSALRSKAGPRGISAFVATAVEQHLRNLATADYLAGFEREHGMITADESAEADATWRRAEAAEDAWRATAG